MITDTEADIGSDLRWSCAAAGKPRPAVRWLRDGQPLTSQVPARAAAAPPCAPGLAVPKLLLHTSSPFCLAANPSRPPRFITPLPCALMRLQSDGMVPTRSKFLLPSRCHPSHCFMQLQELVAGSQGGSVVPWTCRCMTCKCSGTQKSQQAAQGCVVLAGRKKKKKTAHVFSHRKPGWLQTATRVCNETQP